MQGREMQDLLSFLTRAAHDLNFDGDAEVQGKLAELSNVLQSRDEKVKTGARRLARSWNEPAQATTEDAAFEEGLLNQIEAGIEKVEALLVEDAAPKAKAKTRAQQRRAEARRLARAAPADGAAAPEAAAASSSSASGPAPDVPEAAEAEGAGEAGDAAGEEGEETGSAAGFLQETAAVWLPAVLGPPPSAVGSPGNGPPSLAED